MKRTVALLLILCMVFTLSACGGNDGTETSAEPASQETVEGHETSKEEDVFIPDDYEAAGGSDDIFHAMLYFEKYYNHYDEQSRQAYIAALKRDLTEKMINYKELVNIESTENIQLKPSLENVEALYPEILDVGFSFDFYTGLMGESEQLVAKQLANDDGVFEIVKSFYFDQGVIQDAGFDILVKDEFFDFMSNELDLTEVMKKNVRVYSEYVESNDLEYEPEYNYISVYLAGSDISVIKNPREISVMIPVRIDLGVKPGYEEVIKVVAVNAEDVDVDKTIEIEADSIADLDGLVDGGEIIKDSNEIQYDADGNPVNLIIRDYNSPDADRPYDSDQDWGKILKFVNYGPLENFDPKTSPMYSFRIYGTIYNFEISKVVKETGEKDGNGLTYDKLSDGIFCLWDPPFSDTDTEYPLMVTFDDESGNAYKMMLFGSDLNDNDIYKEYNIENIVLK